jgi:hypothetical protein
MADYSLRADGAITRTADNATIPADPGNRDYAEYLAWVAKGGVPDPAPEPPAPPAPDPFPPLSPVQLYLYLLRFKGLTEAAVLTAIGQIPDLAAREEARLFATRATQFERTHPLIGTLGAMLGMTSGDIDAAWPLALAGAGPEPGGGEPQT